MNLFPLLIDLIFPPHWDLMEPLSTDLMELTSPSPPHWSHGVYIPLSTDLIESIFPFLLI